MKNHATPRIVPSGPRAYPVLGHLPGFLRDKLGFLSRCANQYGPVVKLHIGGTTFLLNTPEDIKHVLVVNPDNYDKSPRLTSPRGKSLSGNGLLTSLGADHLRQRRMMQPAFYRTSIQIFAETIVKGVEQRITNWKSGNELNIEQEMMALAQHNIIRTLLGADFQDAGGKLAEAITIRKQYMEHVFFSPFPEWMPSRIGTAYRKAMTYIDSILHHAIGERRRNQDIPQDMLSLLMQACYDDGTGMSDHQVRDEALTLLITGYETIGGALAWTWYLLSQHTDVQLAFHSEIKGLEPGRLSGGVDAVSKLKYSAMILAESMRLFPPTWLFVRIAKCGDVLPSGVPIPAGAKLYLCQYVMHRHPEYWPDPERFDPERFTETAKKSRPPFAYFPFGGGARVCIGEAFAKMEGVLVLAAIAQRFALTLTPGQTIVPEPKMILHPKGGILMRVHSRDGRE